MKIHIILFYCLCRSLAITVHYKTTGNASAKEHKESLKDIRLVPVNKPETFQEPVLIKEQNEYLKQIRTTARPKTTRQSLGKPGGGKKKVAVTSQARIGDSQTENPSNQAQMQKIANQLYLAQKRASLLSDYQKFILSQDASVKSFVLGQSMQNKSPGPFPEKRARGRSLWMQPKIKHVTTEPPTAESVGLGKIVVVTPKVQTAVWKKSKPQNDHRAQGTHIKYVTLAPQSLATPVEIHEPIQKVTLSPYHTPQPYTYHDSGATIKPQVETVHIPTTASLGLESYNLPQEDSLNYDNSKYEFMYRVKDRENNSHFGHRESRSDKTTYGYYFVQLPDGRLETVQYWADKTGYHAKVDYQGQAAHPAHAERKPNPHDLSYH